MATRYKNRKLEKFDLIKPQIDVELGFGCHLQAVERGLVDRRRRGSEADLSQIGERDHVLGPGAGERQVDAEVVDLDTLKAANVISRNIERVRVFASGEVRKALNLKGIAVTRGARSAIEAAGGKIED